MRLESLSLNFRECKFWVFGAFLCNFEIICKMHTNINFQRQWVNDLMKLNNTHFKSTHMRSHLLPCIEWLDDSDQKKLN